MDFGQALSQVSDIAYKWATPFTKELREQETTEGEAERRLLQERLAANQLNGSGPVDPRAASQAPQGLMDFLSGSAKAMVPQSGGQVGMLALAGILVIGLIFLMKR